MTRIRRPKQQQQITLLRVVVGITCIGFLTVFLIRLDSGFTKKDRRKPSSPILLSPEQLLQAGAAAAAPPPPPPENNNNLRRNPPPKDEKEDSNAVAEAVLDGEQEQNQVAEEEVTVSDNNAPKRFLMELGNLKGGVTGSVVLETRPLWAPVGVQRFEELVLNQFYDQCRFFRVLPNFVVQFGINGIPDVQHKWSKTKLQDDPVLQSNSRGTITYATSGKDTRSTQLFINKQNNEYLDKEGFAPFAEVVDGMDYIDQINDEYKEKPAQGKIQQQGNEYLDREFPHLSYIVSIRQISPDDASVQGHDVAAAGGGEQGEV